MFNPQNIQEMTINPIKNQSLTQIFPKSVDLWQKRAKIIDGPVANGDSVSEGKISRLRGK
jgi:hypothetical protein